MENRYRDEQTCLLLWLQCAYSFSKSTNEDFSSVQGAWHSPNMLPTMTESMVHGQAFRIITWQPAKRMSYYIMTIVRFSRFISHLLLINLSPFRLTRKRLNERCCNLVKHDFFHGMLQFRGRKHDSFSVLIFSSDNLRCTPCGLTRIIQSLYYAPAGRFIN